MNKKKMQFILLGGIVAVCLIGGACASADKSEDIKKEEDSVGHVDEDSMTFEEGAVSVEDVLTQASGYDAVYNELAAYYDKSYGSDELLEPQDDYFAEGEEYPGETNGEAEYDMAQEISFTEVPQYEAASGAVCKSDGTYAYMVRNDSSVRIMKLDGSDMEHASLISEFEHDAENILDMHISGDVLVLITSYSEVIDEQTGAFRDGTMIYTYDITERMYPALAGTVELEGYYMGSRVTDSCLYAYTNCYKYGFMGMDGSLVPMESLEASDYVPMVNGEAVAAENIYMSNYVFDASYITCAAVDLTAPQEVKDAKAFLSADQYYYGGENGIYLTLQNGLYGAVDTVFIHVSLTDATIVPDKAGAVNGYVMGTQVMNERDGSLRVIATVNADDTIENTLYIFDEQFGLSEKEENLADGETIQSACFMGDMLYLAAYGENPIVAVDLSDINNIKAIHMKQPEGFEGRLYDIAENKILGISSVINGETSAAESVRLTMFDVSDPSKILVENTLEIQADNTPAISEGSGIFVDAEKNLVGFSTEDWDESYTNVDNYYRLYQYSVEKGFENVLEERMGYGSCWYARGFAVGDTFYIAEQDAGNIRSYDMTSGYTQTGEMYY